MLTIQKASEAKIFPPQNVLSPMRLSTSKKTTYFDRYRPLSRSSPIRDRILPTDGKVNIDFCINWYWSFGDWVSKLKTLNKICCKYSSLMWKVCRSLLKTRAFFHAPKYIYSSQFLCLVIIYIHAYILRMLSVWNIAIINAMEFKLWKHQ